METYAITNAANELNELLSQLFQNVYIKLEIPKMRAVASLAVSVEGNLLLFVELTSLVTKLF